MTIEKNVEINMVQKELDIPVKLDPPYNGLFWCYIREGMFRWPEYINFYKSKRL